MSDQPAQAPPIQESLDRIILRLDPGGPIEVGDLTSSFAALARLYERHYRPNGEPAPKLYITRLETGSIIAEITPLIVLLGQAIMAMDHSMIVSDFTRRIAKGIKAFSNPAAAAADPGPAPSREDAAELREFVRPLAGKRGASLGIRHARYIRQDGETRTVAEYVFDETEINRATINIEETLAEPDAPLSIPPSQEEVGNMAREVVLVFEQASRRPGRESGRTGDRGIISEVSPKALPVYFRKSVQGLKEQMVMGEANPLNDTGFIVDAYVVRINGEPKMYKIMEVYRAIPLDDE
jgi:hypothetical protein